MQAKRECWGVSLINFGDKRPSEFTPGKVKLIDNNNLIEVDLPNPYVVYANQFEMETELKTVLRKLVEAMRLDDQCQSTSTETQ